MIIESAPGHYVKPGTADRRKRTRVKRAVLSDSLHAGSRGVDRRGHRIDLLLAERPAREAKSQRELQVLHRPQNLRRRAAAMGTAGLGHVNEKGIHCTAVGIEEGSALCGNLVQLLRTIAAADGHIAELLEEGQRWIDDAWTGAISTGDLLLDRLDDFVPVPGLLSDEVQDHQAKVSMGEEAAEASSASPSTEPIMAKVRAVMILFSAVEPTAAVLVMGLSMVHWFFECV